MRVCKGSKTKEWRQGGTVRVCRGSRTKQWRQGGAVRVCRGSRSEGWRMAKKAQHYRLIRHLGTIGYQICTTTSKFSYLQNFVVVSSTASAQIFVQVVKSRH